MHRTCNYKNCGSNVAVGNSCKRGLNMKIISDDILHIFNIRYLGMIAGGGDSDRSSSLNKKGL